MLRIGLKKKKSVIFDNSAWIPQLPILEQTLGMSVS